MKNLPKEVKNALLTPFKIKYMEYREYIFSDALIVTRKDGKPQYKGIPTIIYVIFKDIYNMELYELKSGGYDIKSINNGIYKKILDNKTIAICIVQNIYTSRTIKSENHEKMENIPSKKYSLYIIGANCHYWMKYYEYKRKVLDGKWDRLPIYYKNNKIKVSYEKSGSNIITAKSINEIIMKQSDKNMIINAIDKFMSNKKYYENNHISYRLGILLEGDPGTGKTSLAYAIALKYHAKLVFVSRQLIHLMRNFNTDACIGNVIIVIDEIDTLLEDRGDNNSLGKEEITSYIDSINNGQIIIGTTNYIDRIKEKEPSIIRPGRFDIHIHMGNFDKEDAIEMIKLRGLDESFADTLEYPICPSELEFLITQEFYNRISE